MKNWTIAQKTYAAVIFSYLMIVAAGWQLYTKVELFIRTEAWVSHTNKVTTNLDEVMSSLINMETGLRGYSVGGDVKFLEPYEAGRKAFDRVHAATAQLVSDNPTQVARLTKLAGLQKEWIATDIEPTIARRQRATQGLETEESFIAFFNEGKGKVLMDAMRAEIKQIQDTEFALLEVRKGQFDAASRQARAWILFGLSTAVLVGAVLVVWIVTGVNRHLRKTIGDLDLSASSLGASASQFAGSSQTLAEGASEQAASLEETSASLEELSSMTKRNADSSQQAKAAANEARQSADKGAQQVDTMQTAMTAIRQASSDIANILKTIDEIAFQTNILALNAAVEAARAGTAGAGFAVVADEVRALAQRCAAAAKETAVKIDDCVSKSEQGAAISSEVAESFQTIQQQVRNLDTLVAEIATASSEQNQGLGQVTIAVTQMEKITQTNAAAAEESSSASQELRGQAEVLNSAVLGLKALVGAGRTEPSAVEVDTPPAGGVTLELEKPRSPKSRIPNRQIPNRNGTEKNPRNAPGARRETVTASADADAFFKD